MRLLGIVPPPCPSPGVLPSRLYSKPFVVADEVERALATAKMTTR